MKNSILVSIFLLLAIFVNAQEQQLWGIFSSKKGVMNPMSCYGYNIGDFKLYSMEETDDIVICFDRMKNGENIEINCEDQAITVWGYYENVSITRSKGSSCSAGKMTIFYVTKWECYN